MIDEGKRMKASVEETVVAEAANEAVVSIEGNAYFPPGSVAAGVLRNNPTRYTCPWKGIAQYHDVLVGETVLKDGAWSYPNIKESAVALVGRDFSGYVAFDSRQVRIES
jgi:uncharacterized protein (DUF427 family)